LRRNGLNGTPFRQTSSNGLTVTDTQSAHPSFLNGQSITFIPRTGTRLPQTATWTFGIQRQITNDTTIEANYIGTDSTGAVAVKNTSNGIYIIGAGSNTIGGTVAGARNLISGNGLDGIFLDGAFAANNVVQGNYIGTGASGAAWSKENRSGRAGRADPWPRTTPRRGAGARPR